ncbi:hypothetical protein FB45DRAFT_1128459 [Roridomyces roridus]|uniref:Uncharacterized protein n=1 Tax=Roridomyces roridus TaxID=1738132 RepID=A0AAD7FAF1_9AGAR|nr:hypothetical protein FB45DRAFT_1128459 [Roridomyces roridus]
MASNSEPIFPEDVERLIHEAVMNNSREMRGTMALVASKFHAWTKPFLYHTVVILSKDNWPQRVHEFLIPNASFIRTLALSAPLAEFQDEISHIHALVEAALGVRSLAVPWRIWARLHREFGFLQLKNIYLIWDYNATSVPTLNSLRHPSALKQLTIYAPADLRNPLISFRPWGELYLPDTSRCTNLEYVAYAADRTPVPSIGYLCEDIPSLKAAVFVLVNVPEPRQGEEDGLVMEDKEVYPNFSTVWIERSGMVFWEWLARAEGRESLLDPPLLHVVQSTEE